MPPKRRDKDDETSSKQQIKEDTPESDHSAFLKAFESKIFCASFIFRKEFACEKKNSGGLLRNPTVLSSLWRKLFVGAV
jgi:hypothetical protein